jgi:hypothetical protein
MLFGRGRLCNLQYSPQALQFNSSFNPLLQRGVCVAPQLEHSALTPPGAELLKLLLVSLFPLPLPLNTAEFKLVAVAPGPDDLVFTVP